MNGQSQRGNIRLISQYRTSRAVIKGSSLHHIVKELKNDPPRRPPPMMFGLATPQKIFGATSITFLKPAAHHPITMKLQKLAAICGFLAGLLTSSTAFDVNSLDAAILQDMLESYTNHQPTTCTGAAGSTTFTFDWPGSNPDSEWEPDFINFEEDLFLAAMTHTDAGKRTCTIRLGQGGNMYSHFCPDMHGETLPPQIHTDAPWIDEVHQSVSVNGYLNFGIGRCNGDNCPANYVHGAGTYQKDDPYTTVPFYSQSLAKSCSEDSCTFAAWGQQAHLATIFTSSVMTLNKYTNCGNGIIEHTEIVHK